MLPLASTQPLFQVFGDEFFIQAQTEGGSELTLTATWDGKTDLKPTEDNRCVAQNPLPSHSLI